MAIGDTITELQAVVSSLDDALTALAAAGDASTDANLHRATAEIQAIRSRISHHITVLQGLV
jgi:hypothetical protein